MKTAREVAHAQEAYYEDCPGERPGSNGHAPSCDRLTAAIEARDLEVVEAAAYVAEPDCFPGCGHQSCMGRFEAAMQIRRYLAPLPGGTK